MNARLSGDRDETVSLALTTPAANRPCCPQDRLPRGNSGTNCENLAIKRCTNPDSVTGRSDIRPDQSAAIPTS